MKEECEICFFKYNSTNHQPRLFGKCGHTICYECLKNIIKETKFKNKHLGKWLLRCPWDNSWYLMNETSGIDKFPINRVFYESILEKNILESEKTNLKNGKNFEKKKEKENDDNFGINNDFEGRKIRDFGKDKNFETEKHFNDNIKNFEDMINYCEKHKNNLKNDNNSKKGGNLENENLIKRNISEEERILQNKFLEDYGLRLNKEKLRSQFLFKKKMEIENIKRANSEIKTKKKISKKKEENLKKSIFKKKKKIHQKINKKINKKIEEICFKDIKNEINSSFNHKEKEFSDNLKKNENFHKTPNNNNKKYLFSNNIKNNQTDKKIQYYEDLKIKRKYSNLSYKTNKNNIYINSPKINFHDNSIKRKNNEKLLKMNFHKNLKNADLNYNTKINFHKIEKENQIKENNKIREISKKPFMKKKSQSTNNYKIPSEKYLDSLKDSKIDDIIIKKMKDFVSPILEKNFFRNKKIKTVSKKKENFQKIMINSFKKLKKKKFKSEVKYEKLEMKNKISKMVNNINKNFKNLIKKNLYKKKKCERYKKGNFSEKTHFIKKVENYKKKKSEKNNFSEKTPFFEKIENFEKNQLFLKTQENPFSEINSTKKFSKKINTQSEKFIFVKKNLSPDFEKKYKNEKFEDMSHFDFSNSYLLLKKKDFIFEKKKIIKNQIHFIDKNNLINNIDCLINQKSLHQNTNSLIDNENLNNEKNFRKKFNNLFSEKKINIYYEDFSKKNNLNFCSDKKITNENKNKVLGKRNINKSKNSFLNKKISTPNYISQKNFHKKKFSEIKNEENKNDFKQKIKIKKIDLQKNKENLKEKKKEILFLNSQIKDLKKKNEIPIKRYSEKNFFNKNQIFSRNKSFQKIRSTIYKEKNVLFIDQPFIDIKKRISNEKNSEIFEKKKLNEKNLKEINIYKKNNFSRNFSLKITKKNNSEKEDSKIILQN